MKETKREDRCRDDNGPEVKTVFQQTDAITETKHEM